MRESGEKKIWSGCIVFALLTVSATRRRRDIKILLCLSAPHAEKFNIIRKDHGHAQNCNFCICLKSKTFAGLPYLLQEFRAKKYFTDHYTPNAIDGFGDSVLVCKMHDYYCRIRNIPFYPIQVMQAIAINKMGS